MSRKGPSLWLRLLLLAGGLLLLAAASFAWRMPLPGAERIEVTPELSGVWTGDSYAWVLATPSGALLVDTGLDPGGGLLLSELARRGVSPEAVHTVLVTHAHSDHWGAARLFPNAQVYAGAEDLPFIRGEKRLSGPAARAIDLLLERPAPPERLLPVPQRLEVDGQDIVAIPLPGHTPGSTAYLWRDVLFTGDSLLGKGNRVVTAPFFLSEDADENRASLERLRGLPFTRIADGHAGLTQDARQKLEALLR